MTWRMSGTSPFTVGRDETAEAVYEAECVSSGESAECGAESGPHRDPEPVGEWMREHTRDTGHLRYLRVFSDYALVRSVPGEPVQEHGGRTYGGTA